MGTHTENVKAYYDASVEKEWDRLAKERFEFDINMNFLSRYIKPGDALLDLGGGPGRYALAFAEKGVRVTLCDLSPANAAFALKKAEEAGLPLTAFAGDAREIASLTDEMFDHVLLMGPMYHLLEEQEREAAMRAALSRLKPGGTIAVAYIGSYAGLIYDMRDYPEDVLNPGVLDLFELLVQKKPFAGRAFTDAYFERHQNVLPFMAGFPLETLHFLSSEAMFAPCSDRLYAQPEAVYKTWLDLGVRLAELPDALPFAEHLLYIGRKLEES